MNWTVAIVVLQAALVAPLPESDGREAQVEYRQPPPSIAGLLDALIARAQSIDRLAITYMEAPLEPGRSTTGLRRTVIASSDGSVFLDHSHQTELVGWDDDPYRKLVLMRDGVAEYFRIADRTLRIREFPAGAGLPFEVRDELVFRVLTWWPFPESAPSYFGREWTLRTLLRSGACKYGDSFVTIGGCEALAVNIDDVGVFWIDPTKGPVVVGWEVVEPQTGDRVERIEIGGWRQHGSIYLPSWFRNTQYDFRAVDESGRRKAVIDSLFRILDVRVNSEADDVPKIVGDQEGTIRVPADIGMISIEKRHGSEVAFLSELVDWLMVVFFGTDGAVGLRWTRFLTWMAIGLFITLGGARIGSMVHRRK